VRHVRKATQHPIAAGETVRILTGGGGGYGPPSERDRAAIALDVREGYVSAAAALRDYDVDLAATDEAPGAAGNGHAAGGPRAVTRR
jgi:N-methylhydantoinase B/oxoprolinase/acetone carboxylase alpha subunit